VIRDGLLTTRKIQRTRKPRPSPYKENLFYSLVNVYNNYETTGRKEFVRYLQDPYAILLLLNPIGVHLSEQDIASSVAGANTVTCQEYYEAVEENRIGDILSRLTSYERQWCSNLANNKPIYAASEVLREIAMDRNLLWQEIRDTWKLQPDPVAMSFAISAPRAKTEPVTPVIGIPYIHIHPSDQQNQIRFPCAVEPYSDELIQIHRDADLLEAYSNNEVVEIDDAKSELASINASYVVEALNTPGGLKIWDVLCWNDVWLHRRPLSERLNLLWHFHELTNERLILHNMEQIWDATNEYGTVVARNLNAPYDPTLERAQILVNTQVLRLRIGSRKGGGRKSYLNTSDGRAVFEYPEYLEKEDLGDVVEIDADGNILRLLPRHYGTDSWLEFKNKIKYEGEYEEYSAFKIPESKWA
jgi:hypothetical protein